MISASSKQRSSLIGRGRPMEFVNPASFTTFLTSSIGALTLIFSSVKS
uniref:Uncharacterized protein n=1 Tax=Arundo donax TaxID=35708 RepID=A0A0A9HFV9_ARUDO